MASEDRWFQDAVSLCFGGKIRRSIDQEAEVKTETFVAKSFGAAPNPKKASSQTLYYKPRNPESWSRSTNPGPGFQVTTIVVLILTIITIRTIRTILAAVAVVL